jgi:putative endonuclease
VPYTVYILRSRTTGHYYVGHTSNLDQRLADHNHGHTQSIRNRGPWDVVHSEKFATKTEAARREREIKSMKSRVWMERLIQRRVVRASR